MPTSPKNDPIYVTKSFLPPREEFDRYVDKAWESKQLTNNGVLLKEFCSKVSEYLKIDNSKFIFTTNGTLALQLALHHFGGDSTGEVEIITTPFTYVATTSSILWERYTPVFVDIDANDFTIDPAKIEAAITPKTKAILAVHVFGNPCNVDAIYEIAKKHKLKVIYDASHAFGVLYKGKSILEYGDASTLSFHATKLMHTIEGGAIYVNPSKDVEAIERSRRFGHDGDTHFQLGINAKANEFQAAMGLANLKYIDANIEERHQIFDQYSTLLSGEKIILPKVSKDVRHNYIYYPVVFESEAVLLSVFDRLAEENIFPRRYFYPSLNTLPYLKNTESCPISEDISKRIACLPLYNGLELEDVRRICDIINDVV